MKVALITGASSGIGKETAVLLSDAGYIVYGAARRIERLESLQQYGVRPLQMDITDESSMTAGVERIIKEEGQLDLLINNAGYGSYGALEDVPISEAKNQFEVNLFGMARLIQLVLPYMRNRKYGRIINVSSIAGRFGEPHGCWYHATKFAVEGLSDSLRMEVRRFGIEVVIIEPGLIKTEWPEIAEDNLIRKSGESAYGESAAMHRSFFNSVYKMGSDPIVIAKVILKAAKSGTPKTRYAAGAFARTFIFCRKILSDKLFDNLVLYVMKLKIWKP